MPVELIPAAAQQLHRACDQSVESGTNSSKGGLAAQTTPVPPPKLCLATDLMPCKYSRAVRSGDRPRESFTSRKLNNRRAKKNRGFSSGAFDEGASNSPDLADGIDGRGRRLLHAEVLYRRGVDDNGEKPARPALCLMNPAGVVVD